MPRHLAAFCAAAIVVGVAAGEPASALTATYGERLSQEASFTGVGCGAVDEQEMRSPAGAYRLRPAEPLEGTALESSEDYEDVATVEAVVPRSAGGRRSLVWRVVGSDVVCEEEEPEYCDPAIEEECPPPAGPVSWASENVTLEMTFLRRRRVPTFTLREMRADARATLSAKFGDAWRYGYGRSVRCARRSTYAGRCRFSWVIGDGVYSGSFLSTVRVRRRSRWRPDRLYVRNRGWARLVDEYCQVTGGSDCVTRYRIRFG